MAWIKRNLVFVVSLVVALLLAGAGAFYLLQNLDTAATANSALEENNGKLDNLIAKKPYPSNENVELARKEQQRIAAFKAQLLSHFSTVNTAVPDTAGFKALLETTIASLERDAERSGVKLPNSGKYDFTFTEQRKQLQFAPATLGPLTAQLQDIEAITRSLFAARVHSLNYVKRTPVGTNETTMGSAELLANKKPATNSVVGASIYPYEVQFQSFSAELGAVLDAFIHSPLAVTVKSVNVQRGTIQSETPAAAPIAAPMPMNPQFRGMDPALAARYGLNRPRGEVSQTPVAPVAAAPSVTRPGEPVLEEKPLLITLGLEITKLAPQAPTGAAAKPAKAAK